LPNLRDIRKRISSVKGTQKLTRAMKLVATVKLRKAQENILKLRPYADKLLETAGIIAARLEEEDHPLLSRMPVKKMILLVLTSDKGMCGSFNSNVIKQTESEIRNFRGEELILVVAGRKGLGRFKASKINIHKEITGLGEGNAFEKASELSKWFIQEFETKKVQSIKIVYNEFKSAVSQKVITEEILPIKRATLDKMWKEVDFIFEPEKTVLLDRILQMYVATEIYRAIQESLASEHGARMSAMENATRNAEEMIKNLTLEYNKARQAAITKELIEIVSGREAQKGIQ